MNICFVYVTDRRGLELATLSALSVGLSQPRPCHIRIFCHQFTPDPDQNLSAAVRQLGMELSFCEIEDRAIEHHKTHKHVTTPSLLKLRAVASLVSDYDRIIFLDNDTLVFKDLAIEHLHFDTLPIAAVTDIDFTDTGVHRNYDWRSPLSRRANTGNYFNSGVMIFNSSNWNDGFLTAYARALDAHDQSCSYKIDCTSTDQCALNDVFDGQWLKLSATYNMQGIAKFTKSWQSPYIRHYCGHQKYVPLSLFRNDRKDVSYLNSIYGLLSRPTSKSEWIYEVFYKLNCVRNFKRNAPTRNFLHSHELHYGTGTGTNFRPEDSDIAKAQQRPESVVTQSSA